MYFDDLSDQTDGKIANPEIGTIPLDLKLVVPCRSHSRKEFVHAEGLGYIIVGAAIKRLHFARLVVPARCCAHGAVS